MHPTPRSHSITPAFREAGSQVCGRRHFLGTTAKGALALALSGTRSKGATPGLRGIAPGGMLIGDCPLPGETRAEHVAPAHPNGLQLARDRFLVLYATRGFRGIDDDRSICYQLRRGGFTGPVLREGFLSRSIADWDPLGNGGRYFRQHGHPVAFGVPKGARIRGQTPPHAGIFVAKWRVVAKELDAQDRLVANAGRQQRIAQGVEWMQFRLNADESDLEILQAPATLRQRGFESGAAICPLPKYSWMNQTFVNAVPFNDDASEWVDANHFAGDRVAALRYAFNAERGRYEWVQTSPWLIDPKGGISEASVMRRSDGWLVAVRLSGAAIQAPGRPTRPAHGVGWWRTGDLFAEGGELVVPDLPKCAAARSAYVCADGVVRLFGGDPFVAPPRGQTRSKRNPVYCWDIDVDHGFHASPPQMICNAFASAPDIRRESVPMVDMIKALPSTGGRSQTLLHRFNFAPDTFPLTDAEFAACGIHSAQMEFESERPAAWNF